MVPAMQGRQLPGSELCSCPGPKDRRWDGRGSEPPPEAGSLGKAAPGQSLDCRGGRKNVKLQCTGLRVPRATKKQAARPGRWCHNRLQQMGSFLRKLRGRTACPSLLSFLFHLYAFPVHALLPSALPAQVWEAAEVQGVESRASQPRMLQPQLRAAVLQPTLLESIPHPTLCSAAAMQKEGELRGEHQMRTDLHAGRWDAPFPALSFLLSEEEDLSYQEPLLPACRQRLCLP